MKNDEQKVIQLLESAGFHKYKRLKRNDVIDLEQWDYYIEISPNHVLFYSFNYGRFTISHRNIPAIGLPAGGFQTYTSVMIPKLARSPKIVEKIIDLFINY